LAERALADNALARAARAFPWILRVSFAEAVAYRAEFLVWMLSTTMPFVQMALMRSVAAEHPVHGADFTYTQSGFTGYYLATLLVRMLTGAWVVWEMTNEIRTGTMSMRLLRPIHPFISYAADNLAAIPLRGALGIPLVGCMFIFAGAAIAHDIRLWAIAFVAMAGSWAINFLVNCTIGCLAFFVDSATSIFEIWMALWMIFSGYLFPLDLFPAGVRTVLQYLPFHLMMDLPVRCMTGQISLTSALQGLALQMVWVAGLLVAATLAWKAGMRRNGAFGG
jgi:ABC-2 type transport system permease protein